MSTAHAQPQSTEPEGEPDGHARLSLGLLPALLGYHLRRAQTAVFKDFAAAVGSDEDITPGLFGMLQVIAANPGLTQSRLADAMGVDRSTIVTVVDQLEARGLLARKPSQRDRRSHSLQVTAKGRPALRRIEERVLRHERDFAQALSDDELQTLIRLLIRLYDTGERSGTQPARSPTPPKRTRSHDR